MKNLNYIKALMITVTAASSIGYSLPAKDFTCKGTESYATDPIKVNFEIQYGDWDHEKKEYSYEVVQIMDSTFFGHHTLDLKTLRKKKSDGDCKNGILKELIPLAMPGNYYFEMSEGDCGGVPSYQLKGKCEATNLAYF